jgi:ParB/RepB/Spo0J family partition protein
VTVSYRHAVHVDEIDESPTNPRRRFDQDQLEQLAASIEEVGILQPVVLRPGPTDPKRFELVCGARRLRAARIAGLEIIPAVVRDLDDKAALEAQLVENNQRADVSPMEEARAFQALVEMGDDPLSIADTIGRSSWYVDVRLRLLHLIEPLAELVDDGRIPLGGARKLAALSPEMQRQVADKDLHPGTQENDGTPARWTLADVNRAILTRRIAGAPWPVDSVDFGGHGACSGCRFRSSAQPDLWGFADDDERCLDDQCWKQKEAAYRAQVIAAAEAAGHPVKEEWPSYSRQALELNVEVADGRTLEELVPDVARTVYLPPHSSRVSVKVRAKDAIAALEAAGHTDAANALRPLTERPKENEYDREYRERHERSEREVAEHLPIVLEHLRPVAAGLGPHLTAAALASSRDDTAAKVVKRRGLRPPKGCGAREALTTHLAEVDADEAGLLGLELLILEGLGRSWNDSLQAWWRALRREAGLAIPEPQQPDSDDDPYDDDDDAYDDEGEGEEAAA